MKKIIFLIPFLLFSCNKPQTKNNAELKGTWEFVSLEQQECTPLLSCGKKYGLKTATMNLKGTLEFSGNTHGKLKWKLHLKDGKILDSLTGILTITGGMERQYIVDKYGSISTRYNVLFWYKINGQKMVIKETFKIKGQRFQQIYILERR